MAFDVIYLMLQKYLNFKINAVPLNFQFINKLKRYHGFLKNMKQHNFFNINNKISWTPNKYIYNDFWRFEEWSNDAENVALSSHE